MKKTIYTVLALVFAVTAFGVPQGMADFKAESPNIGSILMDGPVETSEPTEKLLCIITAECRKGDIQGPATYRKDFISADNLECKGPTENDIDRCIDICAAHDSFVKSCTARPVHYPSFPPSVFGDEDF